MSVALTVNGVLFNYPTAGEPPGWGTIATNWASAITTGVLQKAGGSFTLTAEADFGPTYGLKTIQLSLRNVANTFSHKFKATNITGNVTYELPVADGTLNQALTTSGAGVLSWATPSVPATGALPITNATVASFGVSAGTSLVHPFINVQTTHTVTVAGALMIHTATVNGTGSITVTGTGGMYAW